METVIGSFELECLKVWRLKFESFNLWIFEGSRSARVRKFVHLGMHKLGGVKLRTFQTRKFIAFDLSNSRTFEPEFDRSSKLVSLRLWKFAHSKVRRFQALTVRKFGVWKVGFRFDLRLVAEVASLRVRRFQTSKGFKFEGLKVSEIESLKGMKVREFESSKDWKFAKFEGLKRVEMESSKVRRVSSSKVWEVESLKVRDWKVSEFYLKHTPSVGDLKHTPVSSSS